MLRSGWQLKANHVRGYFSPERQDAPRQRQETSHIFSVSCKPDGSWRNDLKAAGLGWTFTNPAGLTSHHSALCKNVSSPFMAESLACGAVVLEAVRAGADSFLLESDYQQLVVAINARLVLLEVHGIISYIFLSIGRFSHFLCRFIPLSTNVVADSLAKQCLSLYGQNIC
uniref:RNase H type-1 domain-containing protein n=1 Tax=Arabidopsis thaliana TaxID=3702 RepID=Q84K21_ARATH|nr:hypothetical protein [Arabidopsis thaliana]AAP21688.1 hypothetical protein [Arabidopsis thaliana]